MTTTAKALSALLLAALLTTALFAAPVGMSFAQDGEGQTTQDEASTEEDDGSDRPGRLTEEEREERRAEMQARRDAFLADVAGQLDVTTEELTEAFRNAAVAQVEAAIEAGDIDQDRGAEIIERIESGDGPFLGGPFLGGHHRGHRGPR